MTDKDLIDMLRTKQVCTGFKPDGHGDVNVLYGPDPVTAEAADRIEALTAQLAEDADARALMDDRLEQLVAQVDALTAERDHAWEMAAKADTQMGQSLADNLQAKAERDEAWAYMSALQGDLYDAVMIEAERDRLRAILSEMGLIDE